MRRSFPRCRRHIQVQAYHSFHRVQLATLPRRENQKDGAPSKGVAAAFLLYKKISFEISCIKLYQKDARARLYRFFNPSETPLFIGVCGNRVSLFSRWLFLFLVAGLKNREILCLSGF